MIPPEHCYKPGDSVALFRDISDLSSIFFRKATNDIFFLASLETSYCEDKKHLPLQQMLPSSSGPQAGQDSAGALLHMSTQAQSIDRLKETNLKCYFNKRNATVDSSHVPMVKT